MSTGRARATLGFTMFEVTVTIGILAVMILIMESTLDSTRRAERRLNVMGLVTDRGERVSYDLLDDVNASHKLFGGGIVGDAYLAALDLARFPPVGAARLPVIDDAGRLAPDVVGDPHTGNVLLFVRESAAAPAFADAATNTIRYIDLYRLVCVYPHVTSRRLIMDPPIDYARDLVVWRSERFASHAQLLDIGDATQRGNVVADLVNRFAVDYAWDPNEPVDAAFFALDALGTLAATPTASFLILEDLDATGGSQLTYANIQLAPTRAGDFHRRSLLTNDSPAVWVPDGFELKIVGLTGSRRVWMHVVLEAAGGKGVVGVHGSTVIASPRDL